MDVLKDVSIVNVECHIWGGRSKLTATDLGAAAKDMPPEDLASLGSKKIYPQEDLRPLQTAKKAVERVLANAGLRFMGGMTYAIPNDRLKEVQADVEFQRQTFLREKEAIRASYRRRVDEWVNEHAEWAGVIRAAIVPLERVMEGISFEVHTFQLESMTMSSSDSLQSTLADKLFEEVARDARKTLKDSFTGRERITRRALRPIRSLSDKLKSLGFLDERANPVAAHIDQVLGQVPVAGNLEDVIVSSLVGLLGLLSNAQATREFGSGAVNGTGTEAPTQHERDPGESDNALADSPASEAPVPATDDDAAAPEKPPVNEPAPAGNTGWFFG